MLFRPQIIAEYAGAYGLPIVFIAALLCPWGFGGPDLWAQNNAGQAGSSDLKIEVLEVTTGSGSKTQVQEKPPLQIEVMEVTTGSGSMAADPGGRAQATPVPSNNGDQNKAGSMSPPGAATGAEGDPADANRAALFAALDRWHYQTLASYNYNIPGLADPFMPILEVRGQPEIRMDSEDWAQRPPIERLELNQLKLVAITSLSERQGGAWASFEDGANNSYILSVGSKIGRNHGLITKIAPNEVWVEERGRSGQEAPKTTVIRMTTIDTQGLTRTGREESSGTFQAVTVPGGG